MPIARVGEFGAALLLFYAGSAILAVAAALFGCLARGAHRIVYGALGVIAANIVLMLVIAVKSFTFGAP